MRKSRVVLFFCNFSLKSLVVYETPAVHFTRQRHGDEIKKPTTALKIWFSRALKKKNFQFFARLCTTQQSRYGREKKVV